MPNWVYNTMRVDGKLTDLQHFQRVISTPPVIKVDGKYTNDELGEGQFSYWGVKHPDDLQKYFLGDGRAICNWYSWNVYNWGCKWDACDSSVTLERGNGHSWLDLKWESPWSPPIEWVTHCAKDYPELEFSFHYEEEQGWGGTMEFYEGELTSNEEYDIPNSHADYIDRDRECVCNWEVDEEYWYDDCPRPETSEEGATP